MDVETKRRMARNESLFREANEAIHRGLWPGEETRRVRFRCECAQLDCSQAVELTIDEYERVREHPRRFVLVTGHDLPELETPVATSHDHVVVQKVGAAGAEAQASDPRR